jgi:dCMP deaminase
MILKEEKFLELAKKYSLKSRCVRRQVGAVFVKNGRVIAKGFNGPFKKLNSCQIAGCLREDLGINSGENLEICRGICAEQAGLISCLHKKINPQGSFIYLTHYPCSVCARLLIAAGISKVVYLNPYPSSGLSKKLFKKSGVTVKKWLKKQD